VTDVVWTPEAFDEERLVDPSYVVVLESVRVVMDEVLRAVARTLDEEVAVVAVTAPAMSPTATGDPESAEVGMSPQTSLPGFGIMPVAKDQAPEEKYSMTVCVSTDELAMHRWTDPPVTPKRLMSK